MHLALGPVLAARGLPADVPLVGVDPVEVGASPVQLPVPRTALCANLELLSQELHLDASTPEDAQEDEVVKHGDDHCGEDELPDGAPAAQAPQEDTHQGGPGDPPAPVEDGPIVLPAWVFAPLVVHLRLLDGTGDEPNPDDLLQVVSSGLDEVVR